MENKISRKDAKQLMKRARDAVKRLRDNRYITEEVLEWDLMLIDGVNPSNCPLADQDMLEEFASQ